MRIVQAANFVAPHSGGIKTVLEALGRGYVDAGLERILVVPGEHDADLDTPAGRCITIRSPRLAGFAGYRVIVDRRRVRRLLDHLRPDRVEVSDRFTLACLGPWAQRVGVGSMVISHERLDALLALRSGRVLPSRRAADRLNRRLAASFDRVVCTTRWASEEFERIGTANLSRVPLGVDLSLFHPDRFDAALRARFADAGTPLLLIVGRLAREKRPWLAVEGLRALHRRGVPAVLAVAGEGPLRPALEKAARGLPVTFLGHLAEREALAALYATADVVIAPGPVETFGLAALEALASGTPVVSARTGAVPELVEPDAGVAAFSHPASVAGGVRAVLATEPAVRRNAARTRAEEFPWSATVARMLSLHGARELATT